MSIVAFFIYLFVLAGGCFGSWKGALYWHNRTRGPQHEDPRDQEVRELAAALSIARKDAENIAAEKGTQTKEIWELQEKLRKTGDTLSDTQQKYNATKENLNREIEKKAEIDEELQQLGRDAESFRERASELEVQISQESGVEVGLEFLDEEERNLHQALVEIQKLKAEADRWKQHCNVIGPTNKSLRAKVDDLKMETEELKAESDGFKAEIDTLKTEKDTLSAEADGFKARTEVLTAETVELKAEAEGLKTEAEESMAESEQLQTKTDALTDETAELKAESAGLKTEIEKLKTETKALTAETAELQAEAEGFKAEAEGSAAETEQLQTKTDALTAESAELQAKAEGFKAEIKQLQAATAELQEDAEELKSETEESQNESASLKAAAEGFKAETEQWKAETEALTTETAELQAEAEGLRAETNQLKTENEQLKADSERLMAETEELKNSATIEAQAAPIETYDNVLAAGEQLAEEQGTDVEEPTDILKKLTIAADDEDPHKDNLRAIRGLGAKLEEKLHQLGIYSYKEIIRLQAEDFERANDVIPNLEKRIEREAWHDQARALHNEKYNEII